MRISARQRSGLGKMHGKCHQVTQVGEILPLVINGNLYYHESSHRNYAML